MRRGALLDLLLLTGILVAHQPRPAIAIATRAAHNDISAAEGSRPAGSGETTAGLEHNEDSRLPAATSHSQAPALRARSGDASTQASQLAPGVTPSASVAPGEHANEERPAQSELEKKEDKKDTASASPSASAVTAAGPSAADDEPGLDDTLELRPGIAAVRIPQDRAALQAAHPHAQDQAAHMHAGDLQGTCNP